jgi:hypothetical protein
VEAILGRFGIGEVSLSSEARPEAGSNGTFSSCGYLLSGMEEKIVTAGAVECADLREGLEVEQQRVRTFTARLYSCWQLEPRVRHSGGHRPTQRPYWCAARIF